MLVVQAPLVQVMAKIIQISQLPFIEKISMIPEIRTVPGTETSEILNPAFLRRVTQAEIGAFVNARAWLVCCMQRSTQQRDSSQAVARNNCKQHNKRERKKERKGGRERGQVEKEKGQEERERGERGKRKKETEEKGKEVQEETDNEVEKNVTGWTKVSRKKEEDGPDIRQGEWR